VHVSLSDLEPGDLLFWDDGTSSVQHVAMYVGNNEVIQAPYTGTVVSYSPIWDSGLVGAGRP
jgi:cell wall-associated NlpC family hydrolase